jgi:two-component system NtrC family sensor kinase/two-component system sensor histidine kinase AtoS
MGQMAAHLAHEIRNPVGSVAILASTLAPMVSDKIRPIVEEIRKSIWRVERIIKATLLFTRGVSIRKTPFKLETFEDELKYCISSYSYQKDIEFVINFPDVEIEGDFDLLSMVLQNMLFNAIDAIEDCKEDTGVVEIVYADDEKMHYIVVKDSGVPVPDKAILFDPFKTTKTKGNGLGLALSQQIAKAHGGEIRLLAEEKAFVVGIPKSA